MKFVVLGAPAAGKSTLARKLAEQLETQYVELDHLYWLPDWAETEKDQFQAAVEGATSGSAWVVDGDYSSKLGDMLLERVDVIVWLDYAMPVILSRLARRAFERLVLRKRLWAGNRETLESYLGRDSLLLWALRQRREQRETLKGRIEALPLPRPKLVHLRNPRQAQEWLNEQRNL